MKMMNDWSMMEGWQWRREEQKRTEYVVNKWRRDTTQKIRHFKASS
jgi:hypothetical protein